MKNFRLFNIILALVICSALLFSGCTSDNNSSSATEETTTPATTVSQDADNLFIGTWQLVDENEENHTLFSYIFESNSQIYMAMDNMAYGASYTLETDELGNKTISTQLYYNLNGTYSYEFSEDGKKVTLTEYQKENPVIMTMVKVDDHNFMPEPPEKLEIDEKLVGLWTDRDNTGISYEFFDNGTVIYNNYNVVITYAQYSAKDGKINLTYTMGTEVTDSYSYSFENDILTIDGVEFTKK